MLEQALQAERDALQSEQDNLKEQIATAQSRLKYVEERLALVIGLMDSANGATPMPSSEPLRETVPAADVAFEILAERDGETMHYKALADEVIARRGDLTGDNAAQILVARLVNDDRFVRPARRGFYGLRRDYPNARNVGQRKPRRPARSRTPAQSILPGALP